MDFGGVSCFSKQNWAQLPELRPRSVNATTAPARFLRRGLPYGFSLGYLVMPTHGSILSRLMVGCNVFAPGSPETNLRNEPENIGQR